MKAMNRQTHLAALAAQIELNERIAAMSDLDAAGLPESRCLIRVSSILLNPNVGDHSLPNLVASVLDLATSVRTVLAFPRPSYCRYRCGGDWCRACQPADLKCLGNFDDHAHCVPMRSIDRTALNHSVR